MFASARSQFVVSLSAIFMMALAAPLVAQDAARPAVSQAPSAGQIPAAAQVERGRYIVEDVALCGRCHSPLDQNGNRDRFRWLMGGQVALETTVPNPGDWAILAPRLAGTPPGTDAEIVTLLTTGIARRGHPLRNPMPQFRLSKADAEAVLAYLKSLGRPGPVESPAVSFTKR